MIWQKYYGYEFGVYFLAHPLDLAGCIMFSGCSSVCVCVRACVYARWRTSSTGLPSTFILFFRYFCHFYRAMLCIRSTSHGPVSVSVSVCLSVCLSVTSRCSTKTTKRRITQTTPHDSPGTLVFWCQRSPRNSTGVTPYGGAKCWWGGSKSATFDK